MLVVLHNTVHVLIAHATITDDESQYDTDCGMETADSQQPEQTTRTQRTSSAVRRVRADTPPLDISIDLGTAAAAVVEPAFEVVAPRRTSLAVFITGDGRSLIGHCSKANVNFERDLQTAIGKIGNIYYNKKEDHVKVVCLNTNQKKPVTGNQINRQDHHTHQSPKG